MTNDFPHSQTRLESSLPALLNVVKHVTQMSYKALLIDALSVVLGLEISECRRPLKVTVLLEQNHTLDQFLHVLQRLIRSGKDRPAQVATSLRISKA